MNFKMVKGTQIGKNVPHGRYRSCSGYYQPDYQVRIKKISWFSSAHYIAMIEVAVHEYAGMGWTALGGR